MIVLAEFDVQTASGFGRLSMKAGTVTMVTGPNGVGKSAFLYSVYRGIGAGRSEYYPGHRQINFNNGWDNLGQDITQLKLNQYTHIDNFNRYKSAWSEDHFKSVVRRLAQADAAYNAKLIIELKAGRDSDIIGPLEKLNIVFESARMAVRFVSTPLGIRAERQTIQYDIDQMSDGERAAYFVAAAIIVQEPFTILIIDEPEKHLHPSISAPLISAAVASRDDLAYLFASHDINVIAGLRTSALIHIKNSTITSFRPEMRNFDFEIISNPDEIPESLRRDLLGSRQNIIFSEGDTTSIDFAIYNLFYKEWKIAPKGGADEVISAVKSFEANSVLHWFEVKGIIDGDGRDVSERAALEADGIFAIKCPTAENLIFMPKVVENVCKALYSLEGGMAPEYRFDTLKTHVRAKIVSSLPEISARIVTWRVNRLIAASKVSVKSIKSEILDIPSISVSTVKKQVDEELQQILNDTDPLAALQRLPIKNTPIPTLIVNLLGIDLRRYLNIVINQMTARTAIGQEMRNEIISLLPSDMNPN